MTDKKKPDKRARADRIPVRERDECPLDPSREKDRTELLKRHPLLDVRPDSFQIPTPPLKRAFEAATHTIASGDCGARQK